MLFVFVLVFYMNVCVEGYICWFIVCYVVGFFWLYGNYLYISGYIYLVLDLVIFFV